MAKFRNNTTDNIFPKTLLIRNMPGMAIWQVYHVENENEAELLSRNAERNAFLDRELVDYREDEEETFEGWRESEGGKDLIERAKGEI